MRSSQAASTSRVSARWADATHVSIIVTSCCQHERVGISADQPGGTSSQGLLIIRTLRLLSRQSPSDLPRLLAPSSAVLGGPALRYGREKPEARSIEFCESSATSLPPCNVATAEQVLSWAAYATS